MVFVSAHNGVSQMVEEVPMIGVSVTPHVEAIDTPTLVGAVGASAFALVLLIIIVVIIAYV